MTPKRRTKKTTSPKGVKNEKKTETRKKQKYIRRKMFYSCQYCTRIFSVESSYRTHQNKCKDDLILSPVEDDNTSNKKENMKAKTYLDQIREDWEIEDEETSSTIVNNDSPTSETSSSKELDDNDYDSIEIKQKLFAPNGDILYPCQHCSRIFKTEIRCKTHTSRCLSSRNQGKNSRSLGLSSKGWTISNNFNCEPQDTYLDQIREDWEIEDDPKPETSSTIVINDSPTSDTSSSKELVDNNRDKGPDSIEIRQMLVAPNGGILYPCQHCNRIFKMENRCKAHTSRCLNSRNQSKNSRKSLGLSSKGWTIFNNFNCEAQEDIGCTEAVRKDVQTNPQFNVSANSSIKVKTQENSEELSHDNTEQTNLGIINIDEFYDSIKSLSETADSTQSTLTEETDDIIQTESIPIQQSPPNNDLSVYDYDENTTEEVKQNKKLQCKVCPFIAKDPLELLKHKRLHRVPIQRFSPDEIQKYYDHPDRSTCPICKKPLKCRNFPSLFIKHLQIHTTEKTFSCRICKLKFRRKNQMKSHESKHVISLAELREIQRVVSEDDPNQCDLMPGARYTS